MGTRSHVRLLVLHVLVISLMATLVGRLWYLQVLEGDRLEAAAAEVRTRQVLLPALRGEIYDSAGRPLVGNRSKLVVSVDRSVLSRLPDDGKAVLRRLAEVLPQRSYGELSKRIRLCSSGGGSSGGGSSGADRPCWNGSPYRPIPVAQGVSKETALRIMEGGADFRGVTAKLAPVRSYPTPSGANAAHLLGHLAPISEEELKRRKNRMEGAGHLTANARVGNGGLEEAYEKYLRGTPGVKTVAVDSRGRVTGTVRKTRPTPGSHLITSIDAEVQDATERAVREALRRARANGQPADAAAGVVMDVRTGRVLAMASVPTFDPSVWVGGVSQRQYERLTSEEAHQPLVNRATQGEYPVGSTFKPITLSAAVHAGFPLTGVYPCPPSYQVGPRSFDNYGHVGYGMISLHRSLVISCDTVYYRFAHLLWQRQRGKDDPTEPIPHMAKQYGLGSETGIDLPNESDGRVPDPEWKRAYWKDTKDYYCRHAENGYPKVAEEDPGRARYLTQLAKNQCQAGYVWLPGDAVNLAIGQGDMLATPLQLTRAYAAIANGGTLYSPRIGKAVVRPDGTVVQRFAPPVVGELPVDDRVIRYIRSALADVPRTGTAAGAFAGFPLGRVPVAGKTGTAQAHGEEDTAWFASFAPADDPRYAVVVMVSQGGLGAEAAAPAVRDIYEAIFGVGTGEQAKRAKGAKRAKRALPPGGPPQQLPRVTGSGAAASPRPTAPPEANAVRDPAALRRANPTPEEAATAIPVGAARWAGPRTKGPR